MPLAHSAAWVRSKTPMRRNVLLAVDTLALEDLRVEAERQPRVGVAELRHHPSRVAAGGQRERREGPALGASS